MDEGEEDDLSNVPMTGRFQTSFQSTATQRVQTRSVRTVTSSSSTSNMREKFLQNLTGRQTTSLEEKGSTSVNTNVRLEGRSSSTPILYRPRTSPEKSLKDQVVISELKKDADKKTYRTTALVDLGKSFQRQPVLKTDSIKEEGQDNVIITEPDDKEGSVDRSETASQNSDELTRPSQDDLTKGLLAVSEESIAHSAFHGFKSQSSLSNATAASLRQQKSMENLTVSGKRQIVQGASVDEQCNLVSSTKGIVVRSLTGQENRQQWLTADTGTANVNSRSMESLREHRQSFITSSEKDVRRVMASSVEARSLESLEKEIRMMGNRYRRTVSSEKTEESIAAEKKRGLFASARTAVPSHLSLMPPQFSDRRLTILSPHSPIMQQLPMLGSTTSASEVWQFTTQTLRTRRKKAVVLPRLVLPGAEDIFAE